MSDWRRTLHSSLPAQPGRVDARLQSAEVIESQRV